MKKTIDCSKYGKNPCDSLQKFSLEKKELQQKMKESKVCCDHNNPVFKEMSKYFIGKKNATLEDLLEVLQKFYKKEKLSNPNFILSFKEFVDMFPRDKVLKDKILKNNMFLKLYVEYYYY